ncbi:hypothetical protein VTN00DRAFT_1498 [Thermoascus crustaceus]|uniref:uncharacterized protein n=1 Tax=Thermoascus crustaceus TaxID=5088 RepID=UPI003743E620
MTFAPSATVPSGGDSDLGPGILIAIWVELGVSGVVLLVRLFAQFRIHRKVVLDDYLMIMAWLSQVVNNVLITRAVSWGLGRHAFYLSQEQRMHAVRYEYLAASWAVVAPAFGRISFAVFLLVFLGLLTTVRRIVLWSLIVLQVVANVLAIIVMYAQCSPVSRIWDPTKPGSCWSPKIQSDIGFLQGTVNSLTDLLLTVIAITLCISLNIRVCAKISLTMIMSLGMVAMAASIVKTIELKNLESNDDFTYATGPFAIWYITENNLVIIAASAPKIRPLFVVPRRKREQRDQEQGHVPDGITTLSPNGRERRRRGSMFSMFKTAWDPAWGSPISLSRSRSISQSRDSGYSSAELPFSPREHHHHHQDQNHNHNHNEELGNDEQRRRQRSIYSRHQPFHSLDADAISLSSLTPTSSAPQQQQQQQPRQHYIRPTKKTKPSTSFTIGIHARAHARARARARSPSSAKTTPTTRIDKAALLRALTGNTSTAQTVISGGGDPIPGLPLSMPATPVRAGTPQQQPQPQPECGAGTGPGSGWVNLTNVNNNNNNNNDTADDPGVNAGSSNDVGAVGPFCIWRTREFCVRYEDEDESEDHENGGGPGPTVPTSPAESTAVYDEDAADGLQLFDVGGILGGGNANDPQNQSQDQDRNQDQNQTGESAGAGAGASASVT